MKMKIMNKNSESEEIEDKLAEVLASINCQTLSKETKIFSETQDSDRMEFF